MNRFRLWILKKILESCGLKSYSTCYSAVFTGTLCVQTDKVFYFRPLLVGVLQQKAHILPLPSPRKFGSIMKDSIYDSQQLQWISIEIPSMMKKVLKHPETQASPPATRSSSLLSICMLSLFQVNIFFAKLSLSGRFLSRYLREMNHVFF